MSKNVNGRRPIGLGARSVLATNPSRIATTRLTKPRPRKSPVKKTLVYRAALFSIAVGATALGIAASIEAPRTLMSPAQYVEARRAIEADTRLSLARCRDSQGVQKDICKASARADDRVRRAQLDARYYGTVQAEQEARAARVRGLYEIARASCGSRSAEERLDCLRAARQDRDRNLAADNLASNS